MTTKFNSHLLNGVLVAGLLTIGGLAAEAGPTEAPVVHNGFSCVRPTFTEVAKFENGHFVILREFAGYHLCHETLPTDDKGFVVFPEA